MHLHFVNNVNDNSSLGLVGGCHGHSHRGLSLRHILTLLQKYAPLATNRFQSICPNVVCHLIIL